MTIQCADEAQRCVRPEIFDFFCRLPQHTDFVSYDQDSCYNTNKTCVNVPNIRLACFFRSGTEVIDGGMANERTVISRGDF